LKISVCVLPLTAWRPSVVRSVLKTRRILHREAGKFVRRTSTFCWGHQAGTTMAVQRHETMNSFVGNNGRDIGDGTKAEVYEREREEASRNDGYHHRGGGTCGMRNFQRIRNEWC